MLTKSSIFTLTTIGIGIILWLTISVNTMFLFWGILAGFLFFNVTLSTMTNVLIGGMVQGSDNFWRLILSLLSPLLITLGVML